MASATKRIILSSGWVKIAEARGREAMAMIDAYGAVQLAVADGEPPRGDVASGHSLNGTMMWPVKGAEIIWARGAGVAVSVTLLKVVPEFATLDSAALKVATASAQAVATAAAGAAATADAKAVTADNKATAADTKATEAQAQALAAGAKADRLVTEPHVDLFDTEAEFTAAATAEGKSYPTPAITRYDLPPQEISLMQAGVVPSNLAADASNNVEAFQQVIDWLTSKTNGGTITSGSFHPNYTNPIITLNEPIILKPKVHFDFNRSVRFRATSAMPAMVDTVVGAANRLSGQSILGGTWDAGRLAERCFNFREFQDIHFGGDNMELRAASRSALSLGDPARSDNNFGFYPSRLKIINSNAAYGPDAVAGIEILHNISDCTFDRLLIVGYPRGVVGPLFISRANNIHVWSYPDTQGPVLVGFACDGGNNVFSALQVDNPYQAAFEIVGGNNYRFIGCTSTYAFDNITDPNAPGDLAITVFKNTAQIDKLEIIGAYGNDRPTTRFAGLIDIYPAATQVTGTLRYGPAHTNRNPRSVRFDPTSPPDYIGQVAVSGGRSYIAVSTSQWEPVAQGPYSLAYAAAVTPNRRAGHVRVGNLTGDITINAPSEGPLVGDQLTFSFIQDATGGHSIAWDQVYVGGPTGGDAANTRTSVTFVYDGFRYVSISKEGELAKAAAVVADAKATEAQTVAANARRAAGPIPQEFGAVGDGVTDDTAALQAWKDYLVANQITGKLVRGNYLVTSLDMHPYERYGISGEGDGQSIITISNPVRDSVGLKFTNPVNHRTRGKQFMWSDIGVEAAPGTKACLVEHRFCSGAKWNRIRVRGYHGATGVRIENAWNVDISELSVWGCGHNVVASPVPANARFSISTGGTTLSATGADVFTADVVGKFITLASSADTTPQTFQIAAYTDARTVTVATIARRDFVDARGTFGGVRGSMTASSNVLTLEADVLTSDDIGRRIYVIGAYQTWNPYPRPLPATIVNVVGPNITLNVAANRSVVGADIVFDPAVDFGDHDITSAEKTNDFRCSDLHVEHHRGCGLVVTGVTLGMQRMKLHAVGHTAQNEIATNIQMLAYFAYGEFGGTFEQVVASNTARILLAGGNAPLSMPWIETMLTHGQPTVRMVDSSNGAAVDIGTIKGLGNGQNQNAMDGCLSTDGTGLIMARLIGAPGQAYRRTNVVIPTP